MTRYIDGGPLEGPESIKISIPPPNETGFNWKQGRMFASLIFEYRRLTRFYPPLTRFYPPIISSISTEFALWEKYVVFLYTNLQLTAKNCHYLTWLKSLCSWIKARQRWIKARQVTVLNKLSQQVAPPAKVANMNCQGPSQ